MDIQLIQEEFSSNDAIEIITQLVHLKIKYHENKIHSHSSEDDIKTREAKMKRLQKDLFELRKNINSNYRYFVLIAVSVATLILAHNAISIMFLDAAYSQSILSKPAPTRAINCKLVALSKNTLSILNRLRMTIP